MMLSLIEAKLGRRVAELVSLTFILDRIRPSAERQPVHEHDRVVASQPLLAAAVKLIEARLAEKPAMGSIAGALGISVRQLERLFRAHLQTSPGAFAQQLRLNRAQSMLRQMQLPVTKVALACGFASSAYFSAAYRAHFGYNPRVERHVRPRSTP
jgi:transcriptional regulator GlxA family with amidase domain